MNQNTILNSSFPLEALIPLGRKTMESRALSRVSSVHRHMNPSKLLYISKPTITHVIFRHGLLETEKLYTEVQEIILAGFGKTFGSPLKAKMMGMKAAEAARVFVEETRISDSLSTEDFFVEREERLQSLFQQVN